jgi:hypothetical protein
VAVDRKYPKVIKRQVLNYSPQGRRKGGRPKRTWRRTVKEESGKEVGAFAQNGIRRKPYAPEGVEAKKSKVRCC